MIIHNELWDFIGSGVVLFLGLVILGNHFEYLSGPFTLGDKFCVDDKSYGAYFCLCRQV